MMKTPLASAVGGLYLKHAIPAIVRQVFVPNGLLVLAAITLPYWGVGFP